MVTLLDMNGQVLDQLVDVDEAFASGLVDLREIVQCGLFEDVVLDASVPLEVFEVEDDLLGQL